MANYGKCTLCSIKLTRKRDFQTAAMGINEVWCMSCYDSERERQVAEESIGNHMFKRLPLYCLPKEEWYATSWHDGRARLHE